MKTLKKHVTYIVALLYLFGIAVADAGQQAQEPTPSSKIAHDAHKHAKTYVDAKAAGYDTLSKGKEIRTRHFQVLAKKQPAASVRRIGNIMHWDAFIKEFAGVEIASGKQLRFKPDFKREQVLVLFAGAELQGDEFMDVELYDGDATVKGFVFHGGAFANKDPIAISNAAGQPFRGTFYLTTVPRQLAHKSFEFRMGYQSWGRDCSRFSPPLRNAPRSAQDAFRKPSPRTRVYAKIILPMKEPDKGKHPMVESWIAKKLRMRGKTELRAVTDWVRLVEGGENTTSIWNATVDGKGWGCPVSGRVAELSTNGKVKVELSGWSPFGAKIEGNSLPAETGSRGIATVDNGRAFVAFVIGPFVSGPSKATHDSPLDEKKKPNGNSDK